MKKTLSLILVFSLSLFMLLGCGKADKPTSVVNDYFSSLKSGTSSELAKSIIASIASDGDEALSKDATDTLCEALSKLEVETVKESIDSNSATVSVKVKGVSLSSVMQYLLDKIETSSELRSLSQDELTNKITEIVIEGIKNAEVEERTGKLNLTKEKDKWILNTNDDDFLKVVWGMTEAQINTLKH